MPNSSPTMRAAAEVPLERRGCRLFLLGTALLLCLGQAAGRPPPPGADGGALAAQGERIYRAGVLPDGSTLRGARSEGTGLAGQDAACVNCHGRSGMGVIEGRVVIPPITAAALFQPGERSEHEAHEAHHLATPLDRKAYDDATLARAIREGVGADGQPLDPIMPRFTIADAPMQALLAHLHALSGGRTPGIVNDELNFATIVTPDADPAERDATLAVLREFFAAQNDVAHGGTGADAAGRSFRAKLRWRLQVWQLSGEPRNWARQLDEHLRTEPVFAVVSGAGGANWAPVHEFCERQALPCLFPNVDVPVVAERDFYPMYFSRGVLLEADLMASRIAAAPSRPLRVVQVLRRQAVAEAGAAALRAALARNGIAETAQPLAAGDGAAALARAVAAARPGDALVLWLGPADLAQLPAMAPASAIVLASGRLGGFEEAPVPASWRVAVRLTYPYALPEERHTMLNYALGWLRMRHIELVQPDVQVDTYLACSLLADNLISTHGRFLRDFLVERVEAMAGSALLSGNFRHMSLAPGQRFASKGGYFVRFTAPAGTEIADDGGWIVP